MLSPSFGRGFRCCLFCFRFVSPFLTSPLASFSGPSCQFSRLTFPPSFPPFPSSIQPHSQPINLYLPSSVAPRSLFPPSHASSPHAHFFPSPSVPHSLHPFIIIISCIPPSHASSPHPHPSLHEPERLFSRSMHRSILPSICRSVLAISPPLPQSTVSSLVHPPLPRPTVSAVFSAQPADVRPLSGLR